MLWALLITKLAGGPEEIFMIPDLKKQIKTHVTDKQRQGIILDEIKCANQEIKAFEKLRKSNLKLIKKRSKSRETTSDELLGLYQTYFDARIIFQNDLIEQRLNNQNLLEVDEWKLVIEDNISEPTKREPIIDALNDFGKTLNTFVEEGQRMNFEDSELVRNKNASREELKDSYKRHNELRMFGTIEFFKIREVAREYANDKEWKAIM